MKKETTFLFPHLQHQHLLHLSSTITTFLALSILISNINALSISSIGDFIDFTNTVNNGINNFAGETVYLTTDLDMKSYSSSFVPVGNSITSTKVFRGTFDGQGHVISNLVVSSGEFPYLGIFGYSYGATIKNLIIDSSCSFENKYSNSKSGSCATGGIIGRCYSYHGECVVENCVNMAQITYSGTNINCSYVGGIIGKFTPYKYGNSITNCVNYGNVSSVSSSLYQVRIGGITGEVWTDTSITASNIIGNCVNFGYLYQSGEIGRNLYMGGISSTDRANVVYENCVAFGGITYDTLLTSTVSVGSISGQSNNGTLTNCFWDEGLGLNATGKKIENVKLEGKCEPFKTSPLTNSDVLDILTNAKTSINFAVINFDSRGGSAVSPMLVLLTNTNKAAIPLPTPEKEGNSFDWWYSDEGLGTVFDTSTLKSGNITVYAKWIVNCYTITFTVDGEKYNESSQPYGSSIEYPPSNPTKEGFTFNKWNKTFTTVPVHNLVIESLWEVNIYTITFTVDGMVYNESSQQYGSNIEYPPSNPTKEGFTFDGWYTNISFANKAESNLTVTGNITLYGRFISTTIKIEFGTKDFNKKEVIKEIEKITGCTDCFTISEFKNDGDITTIIIKFNDVDDAKNFKDTIQSDNSVSTTIKVIGFIFDSERSFVTTVHAFTNDLVMFAFL